MNATDRTPADLLASALAADPGRPLVTFYDDATGERVELSVATFANWVAKTANLLQGDLAATPATASRCCCPRTGRRPCGCWPAPRWARSRTSPGTRRRPTSW
ncbi:TIGR03089 family protein [Streptomyces nogalater]